MLKRYNVALKLALILTFFTDFFFVFTHYLLTGSLRFLQENVIILFISSAVTFVFSLLLIQWRIENYLYTKIEELYKEFSPTEVALSPDALQRDVISITKSLQQVAAESKLEIESLKDKENYRREFIGNLAHELKTPLFTVQGYILTLLDGGIKDKKIREKYLKKAANGVDRLSFIIKDLDLITQFETGGTTINPEKFDIVELVHTMIELLEMQAEKKKINLSSELDPSHPIFVFADIERITQVLTNLIVNSFKYGVKKGTTEIEIDTLSEEKILVRIIDNGNGIAEEHLPRLFERFFRVDKARNRDEGGSGLGLAIVKHILEAHKENVFVESTLGVGSEFSFTLTKSEN